MPLTLPRHKPDRCPFGHPLGRGRYQVGWKPCNCAPAAEAHAGEGWGLGHIWIRCNACGTEDRDTTFYEPSHDTRMTGRL